MSKWPYSTATWQRLRAAKLSAQPVCEVCERRGRTVLAVAVDHVVAINKGGEAFPPLAALMALCEPCHNSKTRRVDASNSKGGSRFKGCDINGDPLDPDDDWFEPGGFAKLKAEAAGPCGKAKSELVSCESFATGKKEGN